MHKSFAVLALAFGAGSALAAEKPVAGLVVDDVAKGSAAERAGLQPEDIVVSWTRPASPPANLQEASGQLVHPFDVTDVELEEAPRGTVTLQIQRAGASLALAMPPGEWGVSVRPRLAEAALARYREGRASIAAGELQKGTDLWRRLAQEASAREDWLPACWLLLRVGEALAAARQWDEAQVVFRAAVEAARESGLTKAHATARELEAGAQQRRSAFEPAEAAFREAIRIRERVATESLAIAADLQALGILARDRGDLAAADSLLRRALALREKLAPESLVHAANLNFLGVVVRIRGDLDGAEGLYRRALLIREKLAPASLLVAASLNNLGNIAWSRGDYETAEAQHKRALDIRERLAPDSLDVAASLTNLGNLRKDKDDLVAAETHYRRSLAIRERLAPGSLDVALSQNNLGLVAWQRGDLELAEALHRQALGVREKLAPESAIVADSLINLGNVAHERAELEVAEDYFRRALALKEKRAPGSLDVAMTLNNLGVVTESRGQLPEARELYSRAAALQEKLAPGNLDLAATYNSLGDVSLRTGDVAAAEGFYQRSLALTEKIAASGFTAGYSVSGLAQAAEARRDLAAAEKLHRRALSIRTTVAPRTTWEARSLHSLGLLRWRQGDRRGAADFLGRAIAALEAQKGKLGGSEAARSGFAAHFADYYREYVELLVELKERSEAFRILERSRAQSLLAMLAERKLVFSAETSPQLDQERRETDAAFERTQAALARLDPASDAAELARLSRRLQELGDRRELVATQIRRASPRFASLQYPEPVDLTGATAAFDPGTLFLAYSVGKEQTLIFALRGGASPAPGVTIFSVPLGARALAEEVESFRRLVQRSLGQPSPSLLAQASRLYGLLIGPAAGMLAASDRLLISPDGPLHTLPFGALVREDRGTRSYLVEWRPLHLVVSATVYGELKKTRRVAAPPDGPSLVGFGDPRYPDPGAETAAPSLRAAVKRGFSLEPLPATRREVEAIAGLFPSRAYFGGDATEARVKSLGKDVRFLHFACHGLIDERSPLASALALAVPDRPEGVNDDGLLHAWEIFEGVRIDADLVTLSACETALGRDMGGEGLVGLTRAFQYAGARSVLASLWSVSDESTAELMRRFYAHLKTGLAKDQALRAAQRELIHSVGGPTPTAHPFHWAGFQIVGDWK
jgi:CHAT domain-containing protein/Tfp pilus assembly protein PilF